MNVKKPPQDENYKIANCIDIIWNIIYLLSIFVMIFQILYTGNKTDFFSKIGAVILIILFFLEYLRGKFIKEATIIKSKNLFDTTFNLNRIHNRVDEFYDNQDIDDKIIKLFANNHESIYFTKNISHIMLRNNYIYVSIIVFLLIISIFNTGITEINSITLGLLLSYFGLGRTFDIKTVHESSSKLFDESLRIVSDIEYDIKDTNIAEMLEIIINYESLLSSMNFVLSGCIYNKKKKELTENWLEIKSKYSVYNKKGNK